MAVRATWNGAILAESDETVMVEGNHYFPPEAINAEYFTENTRHTVCPWKGVASYYDVEVEGQTNRSAAWFYPEPSPAAQHIRGYIAFWNGVKVEQAREGEGEQGDSPSKGGLDGLVKSIFGR